jgi:hypothetical protein
MKAVELLYFEGCPNFDVALERVREAVSAAANGAEIHLIRIEDDADAVRQRFWGSPTVRVDGSDVDAAARLRTDFGMQCRVYWVDGKVAGAPPVAWIAEALRGEINAGGGATSMDCCDGARR